MAFSELRGLYKELYLQRKIETLTSLYRSAQKDLLAKLRQVDLTDFQRIRTGQILIEVNAIVKDLSNGAYKWAKESIPYSYVRGVDIAAERLKALNIADSINYDAKIHTSAINILADDITLDFIKANESIRQNFSRFLLNTQQRVLEDKAITEMIAEGVIKGEARRTVSDRILQEFQKQMGDEKFITINGRNYQPDKYSELLARTRTREATSRGTVNTCLDYGLDLCQVDVHGGCCDYCQQFVGRVFSISGNNEDFPKLEEDPPYHPNCLCSLLPITEESLKGRGYYDSMVKLSNSPTIKVDTFSRFEELVGAL